MSEPTRSIPNDEITVVVQGPVQSLPDRKQEEGITHKSLRSVREHLPGAHLLLSTWPDQQLEGLDYDELLINDDPGPNITGYRPDGSPVKENMNRQIISTRDGLRRVRTPYAMKLRSDNFLTADRFKSLFTRFPKRCERYRILKERVVANNTFTREYAKGRPVAFHSCDFFHFGRTEDVLDIWDIPLYGDYPFDERRKGVMQCHGAPLFTLDVTQTLWVAFLNKHLDEPVELAHMHDISADALRKSDEIYANNLIVGSPEDLGLGLTKKFTERARAAKRSSQITFLSHNGWRRLYRRYCDADHRIEDEWAFLAQLWFWRAIFVPSRRLEGDFRRLRMRLRDRYVTRT